MADDQRWTHEELDAWFDTMGFPDDDDFLELAPDIELNADLLFARQAFESTDSDWADMDSTPRAVFGREVFGRLGIEAKTRFRKGIEQLPPTHNLFNHLSAPNVDGAAFDDTGPGEDILTSTGWVRRILLPVVVGTGLVIGTVAVVVALNSGDDDATVESVATDTETTPDEAEADEPAEAPVVDEPATEEAVIPAEPDVAPAPASWGKLPDSENLIFRGVSLDLPDCANGLGGELTLELDFFASSRGAAGSMFGDLDGRMYAGDGVVEMVDGASRTTVNGVSTTEQSFYTVVETSADGLTVEVRTYAVAGEVDGDIDPAQATCGAGGLVELTTDDPTTWGQFFADTPALDMEVGEVEDWSCTAGDSGVSVSGRATVLAPGTDLLIGGEVSGAETVPIPPVTTTVLDDGTFDADISGVPPGDLSIQASHGVYGLGGEFFGECTESSGTAN